MTPSTKTPDDHRRQHAAMNHDTTRAVIKLLRAAGLDADADALEAQQALVWQPVSMRTQPGELVETAPTPTTAPKPPATSTINPSAQPTGPVVFEPGQAPDVMALAAKLREEANRDRRLPPEKDE